MKIINYGIETEQRNTNNQRLIPQVKRREFHFLLQFICNFDFQEYLTLQIQ